LQRTLHGITAAGPGVGLPFLRREIPQRAPLSFQVWLVQSFEILLAQAVGFMYVSEHHMMGSGLKVKMRDAIRENRKCAFISPWRDFHSP